MLPSVLSQKSKLLLNRQVVDRASRLAVNYAGQHRRFFSSFSEDDRGGGNRGSFPRGASMPLRNSLSQRTVQPRFLPLKRSFGTSRDEAVKNFNYKVDVDAEAGQHQTSDPSVPPSDDSGRQVPHFRNSVVQHPFRVEKNRSDPQHQAEDVDRQKDLADKSSAKKPLTWINPTVNHVWSPEEIEKRRAFQPRHVPTSISDRCMHLVVNGLYRSFNWATGFDKENPTVQSCAYRLILLESVAGVPGMIAAVMRHFRSLRTLKRDHGWIHTLLEEAENERMHLLVCLKMFDAGLLTRAGVIVGQGFMVAFLSAAYIVNPKSLHRFVGYLEETAVLTYSDLTRLARTPGTHLHRGWSDMPAPQIAKDYWHLPKNATWLEVLDNILADESHHRDVNHTFASMESDDPNPYLKRHIKDMEKLWQDIQSKKEKK